MRGNIHEADQQSLAIDCLEVNERSGIPLIETGNTKEETWWFHFCTLSIHDGTFYYGHQVGRC